MPNQKEKDNPIRELPKSLQGIETILLYLNEKSKEPLSIRNISENTDLSMRVTKNILLQLERFNQIERVVEKNSILPKWRITKFGKKVLKEAEGIEKKMEFHSREDELLSNIFIPENIEALAGKIKENNETILTSLKSMQIDLSKILGSVLNLDNPLFEDLMSNIINQIKFFRQKYSNFPSDPSAIYQIKKKDEKQTKISKEERKNLLIETYFFDSVFSNELNRINEYNLKLSQFIENEEPSKAYSAAKDLQEEIRFLSSLINKREAIKIKSSVLSDENLKLVAKNKVNPKILNDLFEISSSKEEQIEQIKNLVLKLTVKLNKGEKQIEEYKVNITENMPLYTFYQLVLDENPDFNVSIEKLEDIITSLADEGYLPGIKVIQEDEDHYLKLVQFKIQDISKNELELISHALKFQSFTLTDMVGVTGWSSNQVLKILTHLTDIGILKYSKNHLHGDRWYIISEK